MDAGALFTPLNWLVFHSWEPQKFTWLPLVTMVYGAMGEGGVPADLSPITKPPVSAMPAMVTVPEAPAGR